MRTTVALVLALLLLFTTEATDAAAITRPQARVTSEKWLDQRTLDLTVSSPALGKPGKVRLLLPRGWSRKSGRTWPVLWLLHGGLDDYAAWTTKSDVAKLAAASASGVMVVMPEAGQCGWYSNWSNQGRGGPPAWETFHLTEVRRILEKGYGAGTVRAIAGPSMGGFGAMSYAARHPGMFRAAASFSGALNTLPPGLFSVVPPAVIATTFVVGCGTSPLRLWGDPQGGRKMWRAHNPYDLVGGSASPPQGTSTTARTAGPTSSANSTTPFRS